MVGDSDVGPVEVGRWDRELTRRVMAAVRPIVKVYYRSEVRGLDNVPAGASLMVCNHSGGVVTPDAAVLAVDYYDKFGYDRPLYVLAHDLLFHPPAAELLVHLGVVHASPDNAAAALASGATTLVYPGGDYDVYRPTVRENIIDFGGRTGYVTTAVQAGVPIVPAVSIGGQENQFYLTRGRWLARALRLAGLERRLGRTDILPISVGFPFGLSVLVPVNMPLPTKIITEVLKPIDVIAEYGDDADVVEVDAHVRRVMQAALHRLSRKRRIPILG
ncbi:1-acyl-sn-glycerol-3-phosphate acyltransferase [Mycobacterium sp. CVI_P3]|uniref:1-acyl-sn-glycerol-3-phosphate acyltransferase n=1 Tax=Mycobacterium pinniadriaticum TaxID=2994102 RepID=A0ABT3SKD4_9MYCO|nr:1-acyl-sn-glycerol-3-phosphate acyltransferase [Mycobacterium pinniadriaticum]MCX2932853.1 1-acyl-sn-glycerol-3-phosphate acyltransferase [Mycobacterium pinniadriaticum]MCX2939277.1 1-acyl-sn-glycerol-3-phosphate acyltransferase [Mycobacterium pinniadriaticum]